jgi:protein O-mannosyl-transferase
MIETQNKFPVLWIYIALALATFSVFYQVRYCDFVNYDDDKYVTENSHVTTGLARENIIWTFTTNRAATGIH